MIPRECTSSFLHNTCQTLIISKVLYVRRPTDYQNHLIKSMNDKLRGNLGSQEWWFNSKTFKRPFKGQKAYLGVQCILWESLILVHDEDINTITALRRQKYKYLPLSYQYIDFQKYAGRKIITIANRSVYCKRQNEGKKHYFHSPEGILTPHDPGQSRRG